MTRENAHDKGRRLLVEGRVTIRHATREGGVTAIVRGDSGELYRTTWTWVDGWACTCPARTRCSHLTALQLVVVANAEDTR